MFRKCPCVTMLELFDSAVIDMNVLPIAIAFAIIAMYLLMIQITDHLGTEGSILPMHSLEQWVFRKGSCSGSIMCCVGSEELLPNPKMGIT